MPSFGDFLASKYTPAEQATELYQLLFQIGIYNEASMSQEISARIDSNVDPTKMNEDDVRKFLTFFYVPIRNYTAASGTLKVQILSATGLVTFGNGDEVLALGGSTYRLVSSGLGRAGDTVSLQAVQSSLSSTSGTYQDFITITASNIVIESLQVIINGTSIPAVTSPRNGYMAFYFGGKVYIKIFLGTNITSARGQQYTVVYQVSDGQLGNVGANSFSSFSVPKLDSNLNPVSYAITNDAITNGANSPSLGELRDLLRYWLFVRNVLTKPSDYQRWFLTQPEVGDCLAWGDTENYLMTGVVNITGTVKICLLSSTGTAIVPGTSTQVALDTRIQPYKDVAYLNYVAAGFVEHYFEIKYTGTNDDATFAADALAEIQARYDITQLRTANMSLFNALDVGSLAYVLSSHISQPRGLEVIPYYYTTASLGVSDTGITFIIPPKNLKKGFTRYVYTVFQPDGITVSTSVTYTEIMTSLTVAQITDIGGVANYGTHNYSDGTIHLTFSTSTFPRSITVYAEALNRSYIDTGAFTNARQLAGVNFIKVVPTF